MNVPFGWTAVHRPGDDEHVGYVSVADPPEQRRWLARTLFGGGLATFDSPDAAARHLHLHGLAVLADKWWFRTQADREWKLTWLEEARIGEVRVRFGYDPESVVLRGSDLDGLVRSIPAAG